MKPTQNIDRPLHVNADRGDEREDNVYLLDGDSKTKITGEDTGGGWQITHWHRCESYGETFWKNDPPFFLHNDTLYTLAGLATVMGGKDENTITIPVGEANRDNRCGDFYNALDELVSWFMGNTLEADEMFAKLLRLYADRLETG